jgi:2-polyprenyl-3-methyl-5-hydroxy-6-metoxy-1,4-benzoquinol methylase
MNRSDPYRPIRPILEEHGITIDAAEFHSIVNEVFHAAESEVYDHVHHEMWASLPVQFDLLARDVLAAGAAGPRLTMLDVGCGTGLSADLMLKSPLGQKIEAVTLLDPSPEMLERATARARHWTVPVSTHLGFLHELPAVESFDVVIASSVLHHIPDLDSFGRQLADRTRPGGYFVHLQDPNGDSARSTGLHARQGRLKAATTPTSLAQRLRPRHVKGKIRSLFPSLQRREYLDRVNEELLRRGAIKEALSPLEIWKITDLRVYDAMGISANELANVLTGFAPIRLRSYGFFGRLWSELPESLRSEEERLMNEGAMDGAFLAGVWRRLAPA